MTPTRMGLLYVSTTSRRISDRLGFIYAISASVQGKWVLYVGQTSQRNGALGRFCEHLSMSDSATFRKRVEALLRTDEIDLIEMAAYPLPSIRVFMSEARDHREAVEYLVEATLREYIVSNRLAMQSIARIDKPGVCQDPRVIREANHASALLLDWLRGCSMKRQSEIR